MLTASRAQPRVACGAAACLALCLVLGASFAEPNENGVSSPSIATSLPEEGDPTGSRKWLASRGITFNTIYTGETLSNVSGGLRRGTVYQGKLELNATADFGKLAGIPGLTFFANGFQIHPTAGISRRYVGNFQTLSAIEALPATRLSELWLEQKFVDGKLGLRVGQLAADAEFFIAGYSVPFLNSDWPAITKQNLPSGGPAYPFATPGLRLRYDPTDQFSVLAAIFNGDPAGRGFLEPEARNRTGTKFPLSDPAFLIQEAQYRYNQEPGSQELAGGVRLGAWQHLGRFDTQRYVPDDPSRIGGGPERLKGNFGVYGVVEQQVYRPPGGEPNSGITAFTRISGSPADRNLVSFYLDGGLVFTGLVPGRPADSFGATFLWSEISSGARVADRERAVLSGQRLPIRDREITAELSYIAQIRPGWTVQPDVQYIFHPSGGAARSDPTTRIKDAIVVGLRTTLLY